MSKGSRARGSLLARMLTIPLILAAATAHAQVRIALDDAVRQGKVKVDVKSRGGATGASVEVRWCRSWSRPRGPLIAALDDEEAEVQEAAHATHLSAANPKPVALSFWG